MASIKLSDFKEALNDICRPNRFAVRFSGIDSAAMDVSFNEEDYFFVKAASIPGKTMGEVDLNWNGYKYKIAGDPSFNDVTVTFYNEIPKGGTDSSHDKFLTWLNRISADEENIRTIHSEYKCSVHIMQLDGEGEVLKTYTLEHAHPKDVSEIALSMDSTDSVEEFNVVFSYSYFTWGDGDQTEVGGNSSLLGR